MIARILVSLSLGFLVIVMVATVDANAASFENVDAANSVEEWTVLEETAPNCRYGVFAENEQFLTQMRFGWTLDFRSSQCFDVPETIEYAHMVRIKQVKSADGARQLAYTASPGGSQLAQLVERNSGDLWIIGNEPDRVRWQDDTHPKVYAMAYHDLYEVIKGADPTAQVAAAGLVGVTPGRLQYLDIVWNEYADMYGKSMPVDVWNFHAYTMSEVNYERFDQDGYASVAIGTDRSIAKQDSGIRTGNPDPARCARDDVFCVSEHDDIGIFAGMVVDMRRWMAEHGQQQKPLILTEFGLLFPYDVVDGDCTFKDENGACFTPQRAAAFLQKTYEYLENAKDPSLGYALDNNRLVQQWLWFSMPYQAEISNSHGGMMATKDPSALTIVGQTHLNEIRKRPIYHNLLVESVSTSIARLSNGYTTKLSVVLRNSGNTTFNQPITITFYADRARTKLIGSATIPAGMRGCARTPYTAEVEWNTSLSAASYASNTPVPAGIYPYWITIDPGDEIVETITDDNEGQGFIVVLDETDQLYLPTITQ